MPYTNGAVCMHCVWVWMCACVLFLRTINLNETIILTSTINKLLFFSRVESCQSLVSHMGSVWGGGALALHSQSPSLRPSSQTFSARLQHESPVRRSKQRNTSWNLEEWTTTMELVLNATAAVWDSNPMTVVNHLTCVSRYIAFVVKR